MTTPTLTTQRLTLRPFTADDVEAMYHILNQEGVLRYFPPTDPPGRDRVERMILRLMSHWDERGYGLWAVTSRGDGTLLGRCGLQYLPDTKEVEVDFILGRPYWGQGYATEAGRASLGFGFEELDLEHIVGVAHVENRASQRVLEKLGMHLVECKPLFGIDCCLYRIDRTTYRGADPMHGAGS